MQSVHVITSAAFHPVNSDLLGYSTSKNVLSLVDLRQKDLHGEHAVTFADSSSQVRPCDTSCILFLRNGALRAACHRNAMLGCLGTVSL